MKVHQPPDHYIKYIIAAKHINMIPNIKDILVNILGIYSLISIKL